MLCFPLPEITYSPAGIPVTAGAYPLPVDSEGLIEFYREADQRHGLVLHHPGTSQKILIYYSKVEGLSIDSSGRIVLDLFGGKHSRNPGAINVDTIAESGIKGSAMDLPIGSNSVDEVISSNPYIPKEHSRANSIMDWLPEAARVLKTGGNLVINGHISNPFTRLPKEVVLDNLSLEVVFEDEPLLSRFKDQDFFNTQEKPLIKEKMRSTILRKVEATK